MGIGGSILLMAAGAVLAFAVEWNVAGVDLQAVGWIMMGAGLVALIAYFSIFRNRRQAPPPPPPTATVAEERRYYDGYDRY